MEVEHASHGPEGKVVKQPTHKEPRGSLQGLALCGGGGGVAVVAAAGLRFGGC